MLINLEDLMDSLARMRGIHALHGATGLCVECHNPWPCDTDTHLKRAMDAFQDDVDEFSELSPAAELGKVLTAVEARLGLEGPRAEKVISKLHHLVLEQGVSVTGRYGFETEYQVGISVSQDSYQRLWQLTLGKRLSVEIFATTGRAASKRFLSQVLMDTLSPRDANQIVAWWENNDEACQRKLTLYYDDPVTITKSLLLLVEATIRFNNSLRIERRRD